MQHFDDLETRAPEAREGVLMAALPAQVAHAKNQAPGFARILAGVDPAGISSRKALARLPVTRKSDLGDLRRPRHFRRAPRDAGGKLLRLFVSRGRRGRRQGEDWWRSARAFAGRFRPAT
jgi:phenylacetate-CoA ligase